ncbi:minor tail protein [Arthrobacter phage Atuin]|nr:minor tail protein [Arthrobacter phage Atuin]
MTTAFGANPLKDGNGLVTVGTTEDDIQRIYGSLYSAGLISGGLVTRSASTRTYTISAGVAAFPLVVDSSSPYKPQNQKTVLGAIPSASITVSAPPSGTRQDLIYARQLTPADDGDANIIVEVGPTLPPRSVLLNGFTVKSTDTNSNQFTQNQNIKYSIPYGASLGRLVYVSSSFNSVFAITQQNPTGRSTVGSGTFWLPTDRIVSAQLTVTLQANGAVGFDNSKYCEAGYDLFIDTTKVTTWTTMGLHQAWQEINWDIDMTMLAGSHSIRVEHFRAQGPGTPRGRYVNAAQPYARLMLVDIGPIP